MDGLQWTVLGDAHKMHTHSPDVCWDWLSRVEVHSCMDNRVMQSQVVTFWHCQLFESHQNDIITCDCFIL